MLYVALTAHGFGHASRTCSVLRELLRMRQDLRVAIAADLPAPLIRSMLGDAFEESRVLLRAARLDSGLAQGDSLSVDRSATLERLRAFRRESEKIAAEEARFVASGPYRLIFADIPALAAEVARRAGVPCWMMGNFGWDWIFSRWGGEFDLEADWIREHYRKAQRLFRLPFHEPMTEAFHGARIVDVGLTAAASRPEEETRGLLEMDDRPLVLLNFGGAGLSDLPYDNIAELTDFQFATFDRRAPNISGLTIVPDERLQPRDLLPLSRLVFTKPGYGLYSEALRAGTPVFSLRRPAFPESELLEAALRKFFAHRIVEKEEAFSDDWSFLSEEPRPPTDPSGRPRLDGARRVADEIAKFFS